MTAMASPSHIPYLFLHRDWSRNCTFSSPPSSSEEITLENLRSQSDVTISLRTDRPRLLRLLGGTIMPMTTVTYSALALVGVVLHLALWDGFSLGLDGPCLREKTGVPLLLALAKGIEYGSHGWALLGYVVALGVVLRCKIGRAYLAFAKFWARRNYGFQLWCLFRGLTQIISDGTAGLPGAGVVLLTPLVFGGVDFVILSSGRGPWSLRVYKAFFVINAIEVMLSYGQNIAANNRCSQTGTVLSFPAVLAAVGKGGQLISLLKIHFQKVRAVFPPALRYGVASHVSCENIPRAPMEEAMMAMSPGHVIAAPAAIATAGEGCTVVFFRTPSPAFWRILAWWAGGVLIWIAIASIEIVADVTRHRAYTPARCWFSAAPYPFLAPLAIADSALAATLFAIILANVVRAGLGKLLFRWSAYWIRRNLFFSVLCLARGAIAFRPELPLSTSFGTLINYAVFLPLCLAAQDLILLLDRRNLIFITLAWAFTVFQITSQFTSYVTGLALDAPCTPRSLATTQFLIAKVQSTTLLVFSIFYLGLLVGKITTGIQVPILNLSYDDRFSDVAVLPRQRHSKMFESLRA